MIYDITPTLDAGLAVWPGDVPLTREVLSDTERGDLVTLSALRTTAHLGAHADAPSHIAHGSDTIDQVPLETYIGPCQVIHIATSPRSQILPKDMPDRLEADRVLIATGSYPNPQRFNEDFAALSPDVVCYLNDRGVRLVGIDTPSVDLYAGSDLPSHRACLECGMAILEGLALSDVPAGKYELIALPLKLKGFDASPVRAILRAP